MDDKQTVSSISQSRSVEEMAEFWDTHDATEFHDQTHEATIEFDLRTRRHYVALDPELAAKYRKDREPEEEDTCSMCGDLCAIKMVKDYLEKNKEQTER